jgi:low affinity Fe/Cu permease
MRRGSSRPGECSIGLGPGHGSRAATRVRSAAGHCGAAGRIAALGTLDRLFSGFAKWTARHAGRAHAFVLAAAVVVVWAVTGPLFGFSDTWQLVINTGTTIVTFLMVFLIQNTQNRDTEALHLKLDELIRANHEARDRLLTLEDLDEGELERVKAAFERLAAKEGPDRPA